jgi:hypothetical protein
MENRLRYILLVILLIISCTVLGCTCNVSQGKVYSNCYVGIDACVGQDLSINTSANKTLVLSQPVWDDYVVSMTNEVPAFSKDAVQVLYFSAQMPHSYKEGSDIEFHIHITYPDNGAGNSRWYFSYSWANIDGTFPAASSTTTTVVSPTTTDRHQMAILAPVILGAGKTISSVLVCSIQRLGNAGEDTYANEIYLVSGDFHYRLDTMGSRTQLVK